MADCKGCGKKLGFLEGNNGFCEPCFLASLSPDNRARASEEAAKKKLASQKDLEDINLVLLTTEAYPQGLVILERIEIVTAECAFGMNMFKDLFAGVRDIVGGRSEAVQKTMRDARRTALYELKREAHAVGANAVVGVGLDYVELSSVGSMVMLVASGTAVRIET
ncbi:hypothetical protein A8B83_13920 [Rhodobacteraceae bacterium EhC02]|nr:hypothetical protein A8B83_13920 [Rhodobacteraceae bacterium EhC02]